MGKEIFASRCALVEGESNERQTVYQCAPIYESDGSRFQSEQPAKIIMTEGQAYIKEEGDNPDFILDKLKRHFEKFKLRR